MTGGGGGAGGTRAPAGRAARLTFGTALFAAVVLLCLTPPFEVNHDSGWYLYVANRVLEGAVLYRDIVDVNPPLIVYLTLPPALLARSLSIGCGVAFHAWVLSLMLGSAWLTARLYCRIGDRLAGAALLAFGLAFLAGRDFGQREHLMLLFTTPYFAAAAAALEGRAVRWLPGFAVGLLAALGFGLKPHFLAAPLGVGLLAGARQWWGLRRPENHGLLAGLSLYALSFFFVPFRADFVAHVEAVQRLYPAMVHGGAPVLGHPWVRLALAGSVGLLAASLLAGRGAPTLRMVLVAQAGFLCAAFWQGKGWRYHFLPALVFAALGALLFVRAERTHWLRRKWARAALFTALLAGAALPLGEHWVRRDPRTGALRIEPAFTGIPAELRAIAALSPGSRLVILDTDIPGFFAWMVDHRVEWTSRDPCLWRLPGSVGRDRTELRSRLLREIADRRPDRILVRRGELSFPPARPDFDLFRWLSEAPDFETVWAPYRLDATGPCFDVWVRRG